MLAINVSIPIFQPDSRWPGALNVTTTNPERPTDAGLTENKPSFIRNPDVIISHQNPFAANVVPKLVSMATALRPSISAMSSLDSLFRNTHL